MKSLSILLLGGMLLSACTGVSYGNKTFVSSPETEARMQADSARVKADERAERAERRQEYYEVIDKQADAYRKATSGQKIYLLH
ncbi:hypothetical protein [Snodgrassella sp. CFCC 13594]|uniref:hypothetical protein n=1 Tax=Snodgrassella sp. CFCC 13594 TaxID=1775559 RepID=UPI00082D32AF|nr:hypothetical protein [Snodgrassella sp. CFCC 13594]